jgi:hypothetical protein
MNNLISLNTSAPNFNLVADTYGFIDTGKIVERFARKGWEISSAKEVKVRTIERQGFQKHLIRFRNPSFPSIEGLPSDHSSIPELIVENSHDGTGALKLFFGVFRIACLNGIIAGSSLGSYRVIHSQNAIKNLDESLELMTAGIPNLVEKVGKLAAFELDQEKRLLLARPASGCARSTQLAEAAAQPLVKLCAVAHIKVQYAAAQAVERLAQHTEHGRHVLFDAGVLPPLVAMLGSAEGFTQQSAACAIRQLSMSSTRRYLLAEPEPLRAILSTCVSELGRRPPAGTAALLGAEQRGRRRGPEPD